MKRMPITMRILAVAAFASGVLVLAMPDVAAYCLTGARWPDNLQPAPVIGLCHVNDPSSLMYPSVGVCENKSSGGDENAGENALCY